MANKDKKEYFVKILPEFLFDTQKVFKSEYAPWVYLIIKFKHNWALQHAQEQRFKIPIKGLSNLFGVNSSTISRAVKELVDNGFLVKIKPYYQIRDDASYFKTSSNAEESKGSHGNHLPEFIKIHPERFEKMIITLRDRIPGKYKSSKILLKLLETNYYLISKNKQSYNDEREKVASNECVNTICKALNYDNRTAKDILAVLEDAGYIKLGSDIKITTINIHYVGNVNQHSCDSENSDHRKVDVIDTKKEDEVLPRKEIPDCSFTNIKTPLLNIKENLEKSKERILTEEELEANRKTLESIEFRLKEREQKTNQVLLDEIEAYKKEHPDEEIVWSTGPRLKRPIWEFDDEAETDDEGQLIEENEYEYA